MNAFSSSGIIVRNDIISDVNGENCHTELNGVFSPTKNEHIDNHTTINHLVPNCKSFENYKGVLKENGVGVFNGKVIVQQDAQKIEAFQKRFIAIWAQDSSESLSVKEAEAIASFVQTLKMLFKDLCLHLSLNSQEMN